MDKQQVFAALGAPDKEQMVFKLRSPTKPPEAAARILLGCPLVAVGAMSVMSFGAIYGSDGLDPDGLSDMCVPRKDVRHTVHYKQGKVIEAPKDSDEPKEE